MPAIQLARLRLQAAHLRDSFTRPEAFVRGLHAMLGHYADLTHRPGQAGEPPPLISAYHVPAPVLRQIMLELKPLIQNDPVSAIVLSDTLWTQQNLECRLLAASILGYLPLSNLNEVLQRVETWVIAEQEEQLVDALLKLSLARFRKEAGENYIQWLEKWLNSEKIFEQRIGLRSLRHWLQETSVEYLPIAFRLITPMARSVSPELRIDLLTTLKAMIRQSPTETAYFLTQNLASPLSLDTPWLIRKLLRDFPAETQHGLREALRKEQQ